MQKNYQVYFTGKSQVELVEVPIPEPGFRQFVVKTVVSQISTGTELTMLMANVDAGTIWESDIQYPVLPGYSNIGKVIAVGEGVDANLMGKYVLTYGNHAKYSLVDLPQNDNSFVVPENADFDDAVFGVLAQVSLASIRVAQIRLGDTVVVFGAGLVGQLTARLAKLAGAINVIVADISDKRLNLLPKDKCFIPVNSKDNNLPDVIRKYNNGKLADIVFETTGNQALVSAELECVDMCGKLIITSSPKGRSTIDFDYCSRKNITIIGAHNAATHPIRPTYQNPWTKEADLEFYLKLLEKEQISVKNLITHRVNYSKAVDMYKMLMTDRSQAMAVHLYWEEDKECL